jgi:SAM-dependent methyltransferase
VGQKYYEYTRSEILPLLPDTASRTLEIGCGAGNTLAWLKSIRSCTWLGGIELNGAAADEARRILDIVYEGNIERMDIPIEPGSLDLILCLDVLEHLIDPWSTVQRLYRLLKPGGAIIASIPNVRYRRVVFPLLFRGEWKYVDEGVLDRTHLRFFVRATAIRLLESAGFTVDMVAATGLGKSRKSRMINRFLPRGVKSLFEKQYLIRGVRRG